MGLEITKFRKLEKGTLKGFVHILLTNAALEIWDCTYHQKGRDEWINLPAKPYQDKDGLTKYSYVVKFVEKDRWEQFQKHALEALKKYLAEHGEKSSNVPF
jgi:hypothetical protein